MEITGVNKKRSGISKDGSRKNYVEFPWVLVLGFWHEIPRDVKQFCRISRSENCRGLVSFLPFFLFGFFLEWHNTDSILKSTLTHSRDFQHQTICETIIFSTVKQRVTMFHHHPATQYWQDGAIKFSLNFERLAI